MKFTPDSEEKLNEERLLPEGTYDFEVYKALDAVSKKGNEMIRLTLRVFNRDGRTVLVDDYLMEAVKFKLIHFCKATGLYPRYESGELVAEDCVGRAGEVVLRIEKQDGYEPKNSVKDYVKLAEGETAKVASVAQDDDDDIPI